MDIPDGGFRFTLMPREHDRCRYCGQIMGGGEEAVLVSDALGAAHWWHMGCRDLVIPTLLGRDDDDALDGPPR